MIYAEHNKPGELIAVLSLDLISGFYGILELTAEGEASETVQAVLRKAVSDTDFAADHKKLYDSFTANAGLMLFQGRAERAMDWVRRAYTGYHPANPDMIWNSVINKYANDPKGWPNLGQSHEEQRQIDAFAALYMSELTKDDFHSRLYEAEAEFEEEGSALSDWDKSILEHYGTMRLDDDETMPIDLFLPLLFVHKGQALRRAIRLFNFDSRRGYPFPHEILRRIAQKWVDDNKVWMPPYTPLSGLLDID